MPKKPKTEEPKHPLVANVLTVAQAVQQHVSSPQKRWQLIHRHIKSMPKSIQQKYTNQEHLQSLHDAFFGEGMGMGDVKFKDPQLEMRYNKRQRIAHFLGIDKPYLAAMMIDQKIRKMPEHQKILYHTNHNLIHQLRKSIVEEQSLEI